MSTYHWKLSLQKGGTPVVLFATTTDDMVERDLNGASKHSLIQRARQYHRHGQNAEQDHRDLAIAAFMAHAAAAPYDLTYEHIEAEASAPAGGA